MFSTTFCLAVYLSVALCHSQEWEGTQDSGKMTHQVCHIEQQLAGTQATTTKPGTTKPVTTKPVTTKAQEKVNKSTVLEAMDLKAIYKEIQRGAESTNLWILANKSNPLTKKFVPNKIVKAKVKQKYGNTTVPSVTNEALVAMFTAAKKDGVELVLSSGYRNYGFQQTLYQQQVKKVGEKEANRWVAKPGESEHQTGLAVDITSKEVDLKLTQDFAETEAYEWLHKHAAEYGFILRYPKGKEKETGYGYEPWHYRYLGHPEAAKYIQENDITLEAFIKAVKAVVDPK